MSSLPRVPVQTDRAIAQLVERLRALPTRSVPRLRTARRWLSHELSGAPASTIYALAGALGSDPTLRWVGFELVRYHREAFGSLDAPTLAALGDGMSHWGTVDAFARILAGPCWVRRNIADRVVHAWARSPNRWWRRAALVSTVALNTPSDGGQSDARRTLSVCALLVGDRDEMVVKALSWSLRSLAARDPGSADAFVERHHDALAARVRREVRRKLTTGRKSG